MQEENVNFFEVQKEAEKYFANRDKGKGSGYKHWKRWEYIHKREIDDQGFVISPKQVRSERTQFMNWWNAEQAKFKGNGNKSLSGNWVTLGPDDWNRTSGWNPGVGRIVCIEIDDNNPNHIYIGSPTGGLWKTTNGGTTWSVLTDDFPVMDIWSVEMDPTNSNIVYMGLANGEILKTTDGGATWNITADFLSGRVRTILVNPNNPNIIIATNTFNIYRSTNGGATWTTVSTENVEDIVFRPGNPNVVYSCGNEFHRSLDGGITWTTVTSGIMDNDRMKIAVTPANPNYVYIVQADFRVFGRVYRSTNGGASFTVQAAANGNNNYLGYEPDGSSTTGQAYRDMAIAVSPINANEIIIAGINLFKSSDGGVNYVPLTDWHLPNTYGYVHADVEVLKFSGNTLFTGSDGGIYRSTDFGANFTDLTAGLEIRQFYRIGCSQTDANVVSGGSQDNGTSVMRGPSREWVDWLGADGMETFVDYTNANILYGTSQYGSMYKSTNQGNSRFGISKPTGVGNGEWVTPFEIDPQNPQTIYVGFDEVYKNTSGGSGTWTAISSFGGSNLDEIALAPSNNQYIYCSNGSQFMITTNGGGSWTNITEPWGTSFVNYISVDPNNPSRVAVATSGNTNVWISTNAGVSWSAIDLNLPNIGANCVLLDGEASNGIYVGMQTGIYYTDDILTTWIPFFTDLPNVRVNELEIVPIAGKIRAGTYGRGLWESDVYSGNSGTLPPSANFSAANTTIISGQTINFQDISTGSPTSWNWTFPGGSPASSTAQNPIITYNSPGQYDVTLAVSNANGSDTITIANYVTVTPYCIPDPANGTNFDDYIDGVAIGTISNLNSGGTGGPAYNDYTNLSTNLLAGSAQTLTITAGAYNDDEFGAWIDFNQDNDFTDPGEFLGQIGNTTAFEVMNLNFNVPANALTGTTVMRVRCVWNVTNMDPCLDYQYGETEDYSVNIQPQGACIPIHTNGTSDGDFIDGVVLGSMSNINTGSTTGPDYNDYGSISCQVPKDGQATISITSGSYFSDYYAVWIDWDNNGSFEDAGEKIGEFQTTVPFETQQLTFDIEPYRNLGNYPVRVRCAWNSPNMNPCTTYSYGETEDYIMTLVQTTDLCQAPNSPLALNDSVCGEGQMTVGVNGSADHFNWYSTNTINTYFHQGSNYSTGNLTSTESYYVAASDELEGNSLSTLSFLSNNGSAGNYFSIKSAKKIRIEGFDVNTSLTTSNIFNVYYKQGTYEGFEQNASAWSLLGSDTVVGNGQNNATYIEVGGLVIDPEETYSFIIHSPAGGFRYFNITEIDIHSNDDISLIAGAGAGTNLFSQVFPNRLFTGVVHYTKYAECESPRVLVEAKVNALPSVQFQNPVNVCINEGIVNLQASPAGGTFSGNGVSGSTFNPLASGLGFQELIYSFTDNKGCSNADTININVRNAPNANFTVQATICANENPIPLNGTPSGGTYSGPGVNGNSFDPSVAGVGTHNLRYIAESNAGCKDTAFASIQVIALPNVVFNNAQSFCEGEASIVLSGASPSGGNYFGNGVSGALFNPTLAGIGVHPISYAYQDINGCADTATVNYTVNAKPNISHTAVSDFCINDNPSSIAGANPSGGIYTGNGMNGNIFNPQNAGIGTHTLIYTYTDANSCTDSIPLSVTVNGLPGVSLNAFSDVCENEGAFVLSGGSPSGGVYSGIGVSSGSFDPQVSGTGTYQIDYTYTDNNGCSNTSSQNITVLAAPIVSYTLNQSVCDGSPAFNIDSGTPSGGTYFGNGIIGPDFNPVLAGVGTHPISYIYTDVNSCSDTAIGQVIVNALPNVSHSTLSDPCINDSIISLSGGSPSGGTYNGPGINGNTFDPQSAGLGSHPIYYSFTDANSCTDSVLVPITVNDIPFVSVAPIGDFCIDAGVQSLNTGIPSGGTYSGAGVNGTSFDPIQSGSGAHLIIYSLTNSNGCSNSDTMLINVFDLPLVTLIAPQALCENEGIVTLTGGFPVGGTYSGTGVSGNDFDPSITGAGTHTIDYMYTDSNSCSNSASASVIVNEVPFVDFSYNALGAQMVNFSDSTPGADSLLWEFGDGNISKINNPVHSYAAAGNYTVCLTSYDNACMDSVCKVVAVVTNLTKSIEDAQILFYPNPFGSELNYEISSDTPKRVKAELLDIKGSVLAEYEIDLTEGKNEGTLQVKDLSAGTYILKLSDDNAVKTIKLEKGN